MLVEEQLLIVVGMTRTLLLPSVRGVGGRLDSLLRILLGVDSLQPAIITMLLDKLSAAAASTSTGARWVDRWVGG